MAESHTNNRHRKAGAEVMPITFDTPTKICNLHRGCIIEYSIEDYSATGNSIQCPLCEANKDIEKLKATIDKIKEQK
jgi:hypothetical protein